MRYQENDNLHLDFHGATNTTISYVVKEFGRDALQQLLFRTGREVYKSIRNNLAKGDYDELVRHWHHFMEREEAVFSIDEKDGSVTLTVKECPAVRHLRKMGIEPAPEFCDQTIYVNNGMCDGTPFEIETTLTGPGSCVQVLRKRCV